jgi:SAM-dependent methyltransferase
MSDGPSQYDEIPYPNLAVRDGHPDRLAVMAALHGMHPAPLTRCRVLELGCGEGGNIIPVACAYPDSTFIGYDLSARAIAAGVALSASLGLHNIELAARDIMEVTPALGQFDYIIAHGVYSWVPEAVRAKLLAIFKHNLAPQGVVYVSYNASPGSHLRNMAREMMLHHVRHIPDPREQAKQARGLLGFLAAAASKDSAHAVALQAQQKRVQSMKDEVLLHDDLLPHARSFWLHEVVSAAAAHGMQYLADATFARDHLANYDEPVQRALAEIPETEEGERAQYLDYVAGHGFRRTLLCHDAVALTRPVTPEAIAGFWLAAELQVGEDETGALTLTADNGDTMSVAHPLSRAALQELTEAWPEAIRFPELIARAEARLGAAPDAEARDLATGALFRAYAFGVIDLFLHPPRVAKAISARPKASRMARKQAENARVVTDLHHGNVALSEDLHHRLLLLADGTRTVDDMASELAATWQSAEGAAAPDRTIVEAGLRRLAELRLLEA